MRTLILFLALSFALSGVSADVTMSNSYFTSGSEVQEDLFLHDMDYTNSVSIGSDILTAQSYGSNSDGSEKGRFSDDILLGQDGSQIDASAKSLSFSRYLIAGRANYEAISYSMESGRSRAKYFVPGTSVKEEILSNNNRFGGIIGTTGPNLFSDGSGRSTIDSPSSFTHNISMTHLGKECNMDAYLKAEGEASSSKPASYDWSSYAFTVQRKLLAIAGIDITGNQGNRRLEFEIKGQSKPPIPIVPEGPTAPLINPPAVIDKTDADPSIIISIFMGYQINQTAVTLGNKTTPSPPETPTPIE